VSGIAAALQEMGPGETTDTPFRVVVRRSFGDRAFRGFTRAGSLLVLVLFGAIGVFLVSKAMPSLRDDGIMRFLTETKWQPDGHVFGIRAVLLLTFEIAIVALVLAVPVSIGCALYITEYAPRRIRATLTLLIDLLAAVPSLIFGLWGVAFLVPRFIHFESWLQHHVAFIPIFKGSGGPPRGKDTLTAGVVVALMIVPICTAVMREVFSQTPPGEKEGALALGGTRWGMIRNVVLPFGRGGMIGGAMLGLGRALGETIAVVLIISSIYTPTFHLMAGGSNSISALIANKFGDSSAGLGISALMAAGGMLFIVTLIVNALASVIVSRSRSGAATEI
jgi:phosphate transport system permease protein